MTALNKTYKVHEYEVTPASGFTSDYHITEAPNVVGQSTRVRYQDSLSQMNNLEIQKIKDFSKLERNWDSYDSELISEKAIEDAVSFINEIDRHDHDIYFSSPGPNGEVMLQLAKGKKEIELIFYANKMIYVTFFDNSFETQGELSYRILPELIDWLEIDE